MSAKTFMVRVLGLMLGIGGMLGSSSSGATVIDVSLDTSSISGGSFSVVFDLFNGDTTPNNSVTISNFDFGGGIPSGSPAYTCTSGTKTSCAGISGNLSASVALTDSSDFFNEFVEGFTSGSVLSFSVDLTTNFVGETPDSLVFLLLDSSGDPLPTDDLLGADAFLTIELMSPLAIQAFGSRQMSIPAPQVGGVPEPGILALFAIGMAGLPLVSLRRKKRG
jgi:hypothetical protein